MCASRGSNTRDVIEWSLSAHGHPQWYIHSFPSHWQFSHAYSMNKLPFDECWFQVESLSVLRYTVRNPSWNLAQSVVTPSISYNDFDFQAVKYLLRWEIYLWYAPGFEETSYCACSVAFSFCEEGSIRCGRWARHVVGGVHAAFLEGICTLNEHATHDNLKAYFLYP